MFRHLSWEGEGTRPASGAGPVVPRGGPSEAGHLGAKTRAGPWADLHPPGPSRASSRWLSTWRDQSPPAPEWAAPPRRPFQGARFLPRALRRPLEVAGCSHHPRLQRALPSTSAPWPPNPGLKNCPPQTWSHILGGRGWWRGEAGGSPGPGTSWAHKAQATCSVAGTRASSVWSRGSQEA